MIIVGYFEQIHHHCCFGWFGLVFFLRFSHLEIILYPDILWFLKQSKNSGCYLFCKWSGTSCLGRFQNANSCFFLISDWPENYRFYLIFLDESRLSTWSVLFVFNNSSNRNEKTIGDHSLIDPAKIEKGKRRTKQKQNNIEHNQIDIFEHWQYQQNNNMMILNHNSPNHDDGFAFKTKQLGNNTKTISSWLPLNSFDPTANT